MLLKGDIPFGLYGRIKKEDKILALKYSRLAVRFEQVMVQMVPDVTDGSYPVMYASIMFSLREKSIIFYELPVGLFIGLGYKYISPKFHCNNLRQF